MPPSTLACIRTIALGKTPLNSPPMALAPHRHPVACPAPRRRPARRRGRPQQAQETFQLIPINRQKAKHPTGGSNGSINPTAGRRVQGGAPAGRWRRERGARERRRVRAGGTGRSGVRRAGAEPADRPDDAAPCDRRPFKEPTPCSRRPSKEPIPYGLRQRPSKNPILRNRWPSQEPLRRPQKYSDQKQILLYLTTMYGTTTTNPETKRPKTCHPMSDAPCGTAQQMPAQARRRHARPVFSRAKFTQPIINQVVDRNRAQSL